MRHHSPLVIDSLMPHNNIHLRKAYRWNINLVYRLFSFSISSKTTSYFLCIPSRATTLFVGNTSTNFTSLLLQTYEVDFRLLFFPQEASYVSSVRCIFYHLSCISSNILISFTVIFIHHHHYVTKSYN